MDNNKNQNNNYLFKTDPTMFQSAQKPITPSPLNKFFMWFLNHKKLALTLAAIFFLLVALGYFGSKTIQNFLKKDEQFAVNNVQNQIPLNSVIEITSPKNNYPLSETIPISIKASSATSIVTGFDVLIEYDPQFLTILNKKSPPLEDFIYYGQNTDKTIQVSAVAKPNSKDQIFENTTLFDLELKPVKSGKTTLKLIYLPNATNDSNIIDTSSNDILGSARGLELQLNK